MNTEVVFIIIVVFLVADFIVERILEWVNMRAMAPVLPENLKGIYDEKEYARFQNYKRETNRFDLISSTFSFIVMMVFLCTGGFGWWNAWVVTDRSGGFTDLTFYVGLVAGFRATRFAFRLVCYFSY